MKICLTVNSSPWSSFKGGGQIATHHLASALAERGHEVHAIYSKIPNEIIEVKPNYKIHWVRHYNYATLNLNILSYARTLWRLTQKEHFDVIHGNAEEAFFFPFIARRFRAKFFFTSHAPFIPQTGFLGGLWHPITFLKTLNTYLLRSAVSKAQHIFVFSEFSRKLVLKGLGQRAKDRVSVISPGIDPKWLKGDRKLSSAPELIFWGRMEDEKGVPEFIQALAEVKKYYPDLLVHMIGDGSRLDFYRKMASDLKVDRKVVFYGWLDSVDICQLTTTCWGGVFPSRIESFGLALVEAMAAGLPVISTTAGALPEIVDNGKTGILVPQENVPALAQAIMALLGSQSRYQAMADSGRGAIIRKYSWIRTVDLLLSHYQE